LKLFVRFVLPTCGYYLALTGSAVWGFRLPYFPFAKEDIKNCGTGRYSRHAASTHPFSTDKRCQLDEVLVAMPGRKSLSAPIPPQKKTERSKMKIDWFWPSANFICSFIGLKVCRADEMRPICHLFFIASVGRL